MSVETPQPIVSHSEWRRLTPPGFLGLRGSIFNPGAIVFDGRLLVVGRGEPHRLPRTGVWPGDLHDTAVPIWLDVDANVTLEGHRQDVRAKHRRWRLEDFRLFEYRGGLYSNHAMIRRSLSQQLLPRWAYRISLPEGTPGISRVDPVTGRFELLGPMRLDVRCARFEKNWVVFEHQGRLLLIYSLSPYRLLEVEDWSTRRFRSLLETDDITRPDADGRLSSSANPIDYDRDHFLGACHCHDRRGVYHTWAMKISRTSLRPVAVTDRPVLSGGRSAGHLPGVAYVMAITADDARVRFFFGEGDLACSWAELSRERLEAHFV